MVADGCKALSQHSSGDSVDNVGEVVADCCKALSQHSSGESVDNVGDSGSGRL